MYVCSDPAISLPGLCLEKKLHKLSTKGTYENGFQRAFCNICKLETTQMFISNRVLICKTIKLWERMNCFKTINVSETCKHNVEFFKKWHWRTYSRWFCVYKNTKEAKPTCGVRSQDDATLGEIIIAYEGLLGHW